MRLRADAEGTGVVLVNMTAMDLVEQAHCDVGGAEIRGHRLMPVLAAVAADETNYALHSSGGRHPRLYVMFPTDSTQRGKVGVLRRGG